MSNRESKAAVSLSMQTALDSLDLNIAILDQEGIVLFTNRSWQQFRKANRPSRESARRVAGRRAKHEPTNSTGLDAETGDLGVNYLTACENACGPDAAYARQAAEGIRRVLADEEIAFHLEYPCHSPSEHHWFRMTAKKVAADTKQLVMISHADITERVLAERHAHRLSAIVESTDDAVVGVNLDGRITSWNPSAERLYGYSAEEAIGAAATILSAPEARDDYQDIVSHAQRGKIVGHRTAQHQDKAGNRFDVSLTISPIRDKRGEIEGTSIICRDVSRHLQIQRDLRDSEQRFRGTFDNAKVGLALVDRHGRWMRVNPKVCEMLKREEGELLGQCISEVTHPDDYEREADQFERLRQGEIETYSLEKRFVQPNHEWLFVDMTVAAQRGTDPADPEFYIAIIEDVSDRAATAAKVRRAEEAAKRLKSDFLANVSHEFRTPMNAILGMTRLALEEPLPARVQECLETAVESAETLLHLLDDILDFSKLESGRFHLEETAFELAGCIEECVRQFESQAESKGLRLRSAVAPDCPSHVVGDPFRLRQVISNLLSNAIKFTQHGFVELTVECDPPGSVAAGVSDRTGLDSEPIILKFHVRDTGIGISQEKQDAIFEPFAQADTSTTRMFGGSGLGLAIATELISLMGGELGLQSEPGKGSHFWFTIRVDRSTMSSWNTDRIVESARKSLQGVRILIADADNSYASVLEETLKSWNTHVERTARGSDLERLVAQGAAQSGCILLLDSKLPGIDAVSRAREWDSSSEVVPIILAGGQDSGRISRQCRADGIRVLRKHPFSWADLLVHLRDAAGSRDRRQHRQRIRSARALDVLIAEDTPANQKLVQIILEQRGHRTVLASNGREAVDAVQARDQPFDVILMDVQMPTIDGLQATMLIRSLEDPQHARTPIIALTAHAMLGDAQRCLDAGMDAYLAKPVESDRLIDQVEGMAREKESGGTDMHNRDECQVQETDRPPPHIQQGSTLEASKEASARRSSSSDNRSTRRKSSDHELRKDYRTADGSTIMNLGEALMRIANNRSLLETMIEYFLEDAPQLLVDIENAIRERDKRNAHRHAHSLKGLSLNFDGRQTAERAQSLLDAIEGEHWKQLPELLDELKLATEKLIELMRQFRKDAM